MAGSAVAQRNPFGNRLSAWRAARRESQLSLAYAAGVSQRHVSFLELGRARPSRDMVLRLCEALEVPLRARNELLAAAGFAAVYAERPLGGEALEEVNEALCRILSHHEPYPAFVLDRHWRVVRANAAGERLVNRLADAATLASVAENGRVNFMRLMFEPKRVRARIRNWREIAPALVARMRKEVVADPASPSATLLGELAPAPMRRDDAAHVAPTVRLELALDEGVLRLFNAITTFGTPQDVTVQELRIEMSFPADAESEALLRRLASPAG
jgi:transcriptional regulator with XRE-family HTH domain